RRTVVAKLELVAEERRALPPKRPQVALPAAALRIAATGEALGERAQLLFPLLLDGVGREDEVAESRVLAGVALGDEVRPDIRRLLRVVSRLRAELDAHRVGLALLVARIGEGRRENHGVGKPGILDTARRP